MRRKYLISLVQLFLFFGMTFPLTGQVSKKADLKFDRIGVQKGLSQSSVLSLFQDSFGFIWIGTRDGLNRYDGYNFEIFRHHVKDLKSLGGNSITEIQEDSKGNIWVITENGLSFFDRNRGEFKNFSLPKDQYEVTLFNSLLIDKKDRVWVGGRYGLFLFDLEKSEFHRGGNAAFQLFGMVSTLGTDREGNVLVGSSRMGLHKIDGDFNIEKIEIRLNEEPRARIETLLVRGDSIWIGTYGDGLFLINSNGLLLDSYSTKSKFPEKRLSNDNIRSLVFDDSGALWIGTFDGLNIVQKGGDIIHVFPQVSDPKSLAHSSVRSLLKDNKGSIWVGTYMGGVNFFDDNLQRFEHHYYKPGVPGSLSFDVVGAFAQTSGSRILIGTERGGLNLFDRQNETHRPLSKESTIKSLLVDQSGDIWIGVFREGLNLFEPKTGRFSSYPSASQPEYAFLKDAIINTMTATNNGIWLGTDRNGCLFYFNLNSRRIERFPGMEELHSFLRNYPVKAITVLDHSRLLLATKGKGVVFYDFNSGHFEGWDNIDIQGDIVNVDEINHTFLDSHGNIWISSNGEGVVRYNEKEKKIERFHSGDGLLNNVVLGTLQDDDGTVWIICFNGLSKIVETPKGISFKNYSFSSGFPLLEVNEGAFFKTGQGEFLIGGNNGYVKFYPSALKDNAFIPPVVITNLSVSNKKVNPLDDTEILKETVYNTKKITLNYFQSIFTVDFAALNFIRPENNQYAYQLKGFDEDWVMVTDRRSATYTSLPEGTYTFLVKGSNNDGVWNEIPTALEIVILPPPWKTWWAIMIYGVLILAGFWIIRYNAVKSFQLKSNLELEQLEKQKWKEIHDLKLKYFIDVSHEFRTPLTLILSPLEEILGRGTGDAWLKSRLKIMLFNAKRLLHLIDQILEIREIETGHHRLDLKPLYLKPLLEEVVDSFRTLADKQKIKLNVELNEVSEIPLLLDQDKIEKVIFNLLSNAFKFTSSGGEISLLVFQRGHEYQFSVVDNGQGIGKEALPRVFDRFFKEGKGQFGAGIGLSLTHALVEIMGGQIFVESEVGKGTRFDVFLSLSPIEEGYLEVESPKPFKKPVPLEFQDTAIISGIESEGEGIEKETILVVEDNPELRKFLKDQFKQKYDVLSAKNGVKALEKAMKSGPSLVISDVMMPEMDGFELCKAIKSNPLLSHIPIILLTAKNAQQYKLEGLEYGADDYISKPFNVKELKAKVKSILYNRKLIQEKFRKRESLNVLPALVNGQDEQLIKKISDLIIENLDQPNLTVDFIGDQVGLSRVHLFRKIKALTGLSPSELLKDYRMGQAMKMLSSGKFRVSDVAYSVGFQDVAYFGKVFKKHFGQSPTEVKIEERVEGD